jgi:repressor LexA
MLLEKLNQRFTLELARENIKEFALISEQGQERLVRAIMPSFQENARLQKDAFSALIKSQQELLEELVVILKNQQANFEQLTQIQREGQGHHGVTRRRIDEQKEASSTFRERQFTTKTASGIQPKMLKFIEDYNEREDMPPTTREIAQALGISNGQVNYHLMMLEKKGLISQASRNRRSIRLLKSIRGVPVMGYIAAGTPLEISNDPEEMIDVGNDMELENTYVLIVKGRSMIEEGILDGDYVVIKPQSTYNSGDLIVAVHNEPESSGATLKRFFREGDLIRLQPANSELSPLYISAAEWISEWTVQGKVMEIIRMG